MTRSLITNLNVNSLYQIAPQNFTSINVKLIKQYNYHIVELYS